MTGTSNLYFFSWLIISETLSCILYSISFNNWYHSEYNIYDCFTDHTDFVKRRFIITNWPNNHILFCVVKIRASWVKVEGTEEGKNMYIFGQTLIGCKWYTVDYHLIGINWNQTHNMLSLSTGAPLTNMV